MKLKNTTTGKVKEFKKRHAERILSIKNTKWEKVKEDESSRTNQKREE